MRLSSFFTNAKKMINSVKRQSLSRDERKQKAIYLAQQILEEARLVETKKEKVEQVELAGMMDDPHGKIFTTLVTDECFRSKQTKRVASQLTYVIDTFGIPAYLPKSKQLALKAFQRFSSFFHPILVPCVSQIVRKATKNVILPGEEVALTKHMRSREKEGVRVNLNHLGEAILGEKEASQRLNVYLEDLRKPEVEYISIKISTIYSQIQLLAWDKTLDILAERLRILYRTSKQHLFQKTDGSFVPKFVNLDMEEYRDLHLTVALFKKVLSEPEFFDYSAGIVLQSYLPDSFLIQKELTVWALQRHIEGGAPIKIRIVKGANLAMEQFESSLKGWIQAPYSSKLEVDANYKRMMIYGCEKKHAEAVHLGVASHNLFDIAYALLLRSENEIEPYVCFEMLEGMADPIRRVVQALAGDMLLYCPAAKKEEFQNAVAYLVRRLDENSAPENFLRHLFDLKPNSPSWKEQVDRFSSACDFVEGLSFLPRRKQNRLQYCQNDTSFFKNEPDTDWSLPQNRRWAKAIIEKWIQNQILPIPFVIVEKEYFSQEKKGVGEDPSKPGQSLYEYGLATETEIDHALSSAKKAEEKWNKVSVQERKKLLLKVSDELRLARGDLIGAMIVDAGKTITEGDVEVSEAIDFADYYAHNIEEWDSIQDIRWKPKGVVLVASPWNFPCSIAAGGILAALAAGNVVLYKPARETVLVSWILVQLFWKAGIDRDVLQFILCEDEPVGSSLVKDSRVNTVLLTGATETAKKFLKMRPGLDLIAETGGKNILVVSAMSDRDLAIKDLVQSAFGHSGQKCSACSLAILEAEVYDDPHFLDQLKDAVQSLHVGSPWDTASKVIPLIQSPGETLKRGLTELEPGESWLLEPKQDSENPQLWSPGIKLGVTPKSFTFQNELFGPVLGLVRAKDLDQAFEWMNQTSYGLTAGFHSLDEREQKQWLEKVEAGNCYINRTITGAIVERQPFGGCKESGFGKGAKAGGPNYLIELMEAEEVFLPKEQAHLTDSIKQVYEKAREEHLIPEEKEEIWRKSLESYIFYWLEYFSKSHDPALIWGQDNLQTYRPRKQLLLRAQKGDSFLDLARVYVASLICKMPLQISVEEDIQKENFRKINVNVFLESNEELALRVAKDKIERVRVLKQPSSFLLKVFADRAVKLSVAPVLSNGRLELLHLLREVSISRDYHRYGNLGVREKEKRAPLPGEEVKKIKNCVDCHCYE